MSENIIVSPFINQVTVTENTNKVIYSAPGPQGPAGTFNAGEIPTVYPILNTSGSIALSSSYFPASATYSASAGTSASLNGNAASDYALKTYANSASLNAYSQASAFAVTQSNSASLNAYNSASTFTTSQGYQKSTGSVAYAASAGNSSSTSQTNFSSLTISGSNVPTQDYVEYLVGDLATNLVSYIDYQDLSYSSSAQTYADSASLNAYNSASTFTVNQGYQTSSGSVTYATNSGTSASTTQTSFNNLNVTNSTPSTNTTNGALVVAGGLGVGDSLNVGGNLSVTGNIYQSGSIVTISASNIEIADSVIYLSASNYNADLLDIGFYGAYGSGSYVGTASHRHTGLVRDHLDGIWKLFSFGNEPTTGVIDFTTASYDTLKLGSIQANIAASANKGIVVKAAPSQTANLQEWQDSSGTIMARISSIGQFITSTEVYANNYQNNSGNFTLANGGQLTLKNTAIGSVVSTVRGASGQTANLQEWQNSSASTLAGVTASGQIYTGSNVPLTNSSGSTAQLSVQSSSSNPGIIARLASGQTANLQEWQNSSGSVLTAITASGAISSSVGGHILQSQASSIIPLRLLSPSTGGQSGLYFEAYDATNGVSRASINSNGTGTFQGGVAAGGSYSNSRLSVLTNNATVLGLVIQGAASQSADLQQWVNSSGSVLAGVSTFGAIYTGSNTPLLSATGASAQLSVRTSSSANPAVVIRAASAQGVNLMEWQDSTGAIIARVLSQGAIGHGGTYGPSMSDATGTGPYFSMGTNTAFLLNRTATGNINFVIRGMAGQTGDLEQWQNSAVGVLGGITASGFIYSGSSTLSTSTGSVAQLSVRATASNNVAIIARGASAQGANIQEWQDSTGAAVSWITNSGNLAFSAANTFNIFWGTLPVITGTTAPNTLIFKALAANRYVATFQGLSLQTADLTQWQNVNASTLAGITASGQIYTGSSTLASPTGSIAQLSVRSTASNNAGIIVRGASAQGTNLQEWQDSAGNVQSYVSATGARIYAPQIQIAQAGNFSNVTDTTQGTISIPSTGVKIATAQAANVVLTIQNTAANITANLTQWTSSANTVLAGVTSSGQIYTGSTVPLTNSSGSTAQLSIQSTASTNPGVVVRAASTQSYNLEEWQGSNGTAVAYITSLGSFVGNAQMYVPSVNNSSTSTNAQVALPATGTKISTGVSSNVALTVQNTLAGSTGDLTQWTSSAGTVLTSILSNGAVLSSTFSVIGSGTVGPQTGVSNGAIQFNNPGVLVLSQNSTAIPLTIKNSTAGATTALTQWTSSANAVLAQIPIDGSIITSATNGVLTNRLQNTGLDNKARLSLNATNVSFEFLTNVITNSAMTIRNIAASTTGNLLTVQNTNSDTKFALQSDYPSSSAVGASTTYGLWMYLGNTAAAPTANPTGGGYMFVDSGSLKYRGPSGTVTTLAIP